MRRDEAHDATGRLPRVALAARAIALGLCLGLVESLGIECVTLRDNSNDDNNNNNNHNDDDSYGVTAVVDADDRVQHTASSSSRLATARHAVGVWRSLRYVRMPAWSLLCRDPRLWRAMRKTLRANALVALLALAASLLTACASDERDTAAHLNTAALVTAASTRGGAGHGDCRDRYCSLQTDTHRTAAAAVANTTLRVSNDTTTTTTSSAHVTTRLRAAWSHSPVVFSGGGGGGGATAAAATPLSMRWCVSMAVWLLQQQLMRRVRRVRRVAVRVAALCVTYAGQWPLYIALQLVALVWYSQLYHETWMLRKGMCLGYHNNDNNNDDDDGDGRHGGDGDVLHSAAVVVRWPLLRRVICDDDDDDDDAQRRQQRQAEAQVRRRATTTTTTTLRRSTLHAALCDVAQRSVVLVCLLLLCALPPTPRRVWVVGDAAAMRRRHPRRATLRTTFELTSESLFKFAATMLFAYSVHAGEVAMLPRCAVVARVVGFVLNALLYSFYVFDYRYGAQYTPHGTRASLHAQLTHYERHWPYNIGYGCCATALSYAIAARAGAVVAMCVVSVLYAWHVVCSGYAQPVAAPWRMPLFTPWFRLVDALQRGMAVVWRVVAVVLLAWLLRVQVRRLVDAATT